MSEILPATCEAGVVKIEDVPISPATILSSGVKASVGVGLLQDEVVTYVTSNASDIKDLITNIGDVIDKIQNVLTGLDAVTTAPGSMATLIAFITTSKTALAAQKDMLK